MTCQPRLHLKIRVAVEAKEETKIHAEIETEQKSTEEEVEQHLLREWLKEYGVVPRPLLAPFSILHTDGADAYRKLHRETGESINIFQHLQPKSTFLTI